MVHIEFQGIASWHIAEQLALIPDSRAACLNSRWMHTLFTTPRSVGYRYGFLQCGCTPAWYLFSTVLPSCSSVMRLCIFMTIQMHVSHTHVECETKFLNMAWQTATDHHTMSTLTFSQRKTVCDLSIGVECVIHHKRDVHEE